MTKSYTVHTIHITPSGKEQHRFAAEYGDPEAAVAYARRLERLGYCVEIRTDDSDLVAQSIEEQF